MQRRDKRVGRSRYFESLESRNLLAGNVTASVVEDDLVITGDAAANNIQVSQPANGDWQVKVIGTKVNGSNSAHTFSGVNDIDIYLDAGNDVSKMQNGTLSGEVGVHYTPGVQGSKSTQLAI